MILQDIILRRPSFAEKKSRLCCAAYYAGEAYLAFVTWQKSVHPLYHGLGSVGLVRSIVRDMCYECVFGRW